MQIKSNKYNNIPALVILTVVATFLGSVSAARRADIDSQRRAKARYYYIEASTALAEDRNTEAYELMRKAYQTDPDYAEAAYAYANLRMSLRNDTLRSKTEYDKSIRMMRPLIDMFPGETSEAMQYSYLAAHGGDMDEAIRVAERTDSLFPDLTQTLLQLSSYYAAKQDFGKAVKCLDRYERIEGSNPQLSMRKLSLLFSASDTAALISETDRLIRENPVNPDYLILRGNVYEALEMPDSAIVNYLKAEDLDPEDGNTKLTLANFYLQQGDSVMYDAKSEEALLSENLELEEKIDMLTHYMQTLLKDSADTKRADRLFEGLLSQYPHEASVLDLGAQYSSATGDLTKAEELMSYATDLEPENPDHWGRLMVYYFSDDKYTDAIEAYERAQSKGLEPTNSMTTVYAISASNADQHEKALKAYQELLDNTFPGALLTDSTSAILAKGGNLSYDQLMKAADIFTMAGDASYKAGNVKDAMQEYENSMTLNPENMMAVNNYAYYMALTGGDLEKAEELSRRTIENQPDNPTYLDTYGWILCLQGKYAEALEVMEDALAQATEQESLVGEYYDHLGDILFHMGEKDKAVENWKKALDLDKGNKEIEAKIKKKSL